VLQRQQLRGSVVGAGICCEGVAVQGVGVHCAMRGNWGRAQAGRVKWGEGNKKAAGQRSCWLRWQCCKGIAVQGVEVHCTNGEERRQYVC
jgi:hypothetical protein